MDAILFDHPEIRIDLLPFTFTRAVAEIRCGILKISEKWSRSLDGSVAFMTDALLSPLYPGGPADYALYINGALCPEARILDQILQLDDQTILMEGDMPLAWKSDRQTAQDIVAGNPVHTHRGKAVAHPVSLIAHPWHIFQFNRKQIEADFALITRGRTSADIQDRHTRTYGESNIFVEEGARIYAAVINAERGPVYIGKNTEVAEGAIVRGAFALGSDSWLKPGTKIIGDSTIGPHCKVGGEISNAVIFGHSNKAHDGFLGNSVIGSWCNIGAGTDTSNLKNNYGPVKMWSYREQGYVSSGQMFCGLMMGDHSKCSIHTRFNTGTVVGVGANIFGAGIPPKFVPSFSWGVDGEYRYEDFVKTASLVYARRDRKFSQGEADVLARLFDLTAKYRNNR
jgi:UDP-N-acetylglucosamine diphosphorylase/glucosamine-1-phosphate N-acetyltransferase